MFYSILQKISTILSLTLVPASSLLAQHTDPVQLAAIPYTLHWENKPASFQLKEKKLVIGSGPKTDLFRAPALTYHTANAPMLLFNADSNFVLSASIEHAFTNKWDAGAIVLKSDSLNWIKFCFEKDYTGARRVVSVVTKNLSDDCNSVEITSNKVFFKIAKAGNTVSLYYSENGTAWFLVRHCSFDAKPGFEVGFLSQSPIASNCVVTFSDIHYQKKKIKDPFLGE